MKLLTAVIILFLFSCSAKTNQLEDQVHTLNLQYITWGCECASWATPEDIDKYANKGDELARRCIFIEPANPGLALPDTMDYDTEVIQFTGRFYKEKDYPKGFVNKVEDAAKARVLRYTSYKVIKNNNREIY